jgi:hypothetical protein
MHDLAKLVFDFKQYQGVANVKRAVSKYSMQTNKICRLFDSDAATSSFTSQIKNGKMFGTFLVALDAKTKIIKKQKQRYRISKCQHTSRIHFAKGMCRYCYFEQKKKVNDDRMLMS